MSKIERRGHVQSQKMCIGASNDEIMPDSFLSERSILSQSHLFLLCGESQT